VGLCAIVIWQREAILSPDSTAVHVLLVGGLLALVLSPVFKEIEFGGVVLKREIAEARREVATAKQELQGQITQLNQDLRIRLDAQQTQSQHLYLGAVAPTDSAIAAEEERVRNLLDRALKERGIAPATRPVHLDLPTTVRDLVLARAALERRVRATWLSRFDHGFRDQYRPFGRMLSELVEAGIIPSEYGRVMREVYAISSRAVHGEDVTEKQRKFVLESLPDIHAYIDDLSKRLPEYQRALGDAIADAATPVAEA
jgi:hypothetical protein